MNTFKAEMAEIAPVIKEVVDGGGNFTLGVTGISMCPLFWENRDSVILSKPDKIKKFDIILYKRSNGHFVLHRIVKIKNNIYSLCGDNQNVIEYPIYPEQVIAKVIGFIRKGKVYKTSDFIYKLYVFIWGHTLKCRKFMMRSYFYLSTRVKKILNYFKKH